MYFRHQTCSLIKMMFKHFKYWLPFIVSINIDHLVRPRTSMKQRIYERVFRKRSVSVYRGLR